MNNFFSLQLLAQIIGAGGMAFLFASYQQTTHKRLIACKLGADVMWVMHYLCLSAYAGAIPNFVGIFREVIFMQSDKKMGALAHFPLPVHPHQLDAGDFILAIHAVAAADLCLHLRHHLAVGEKSEDHPHDRRAGILLLPHLRHLRRLMDRRHQRIGGNRVHRVLLHPQRFEKEAVNDSQNKTRNAIFPHSSSILMWRRQLVQMPPIYT